MLPALAGFAAKALLPSEKKVDKDKFFEKKKASSIQKIDDEGAVVKEPVIKKKTISTNLFLPPAEIKALPPAAEVKKNVKTGRLDDIFNRVGKTLQGIIDVLNNRNQTQKEEETNKKEQTKLEDKKEREDKLKKEAKKKPFKMPNIQAPGDKFNLMRFFGNVLLGSLALAIFKNLEEIIETLKNVFQTVKDFIEKIGKFFSPIWEGLKWITGEGTKLIGQLLGVPPENLDSKDLKKNIDEIAKKIPFLKNLFEGINNTINSLRGSGGEQPQPGGGGYSGPETPLGEGETTSANRVYSGLVQRGFSKEEAAAITGNIAAESSFRTGAENPKSGAFGLMQWAYGRKSRLIQFAQQKGKPVTDLNLQLDYIVWELKGGNAYETAQFQKAMSYGPDVASKTKGFAYEVERASASEIQGSLSRRIGAAKTVYGSKLQTTPQQRQRQADRIAQQAAVEVATQTQAPPAPALPSPQQAAATATAATALPSPQQAAVTATAASLQPPAPAQVSPEQAPPPISASVPQIMQQADYEITGGASSSTILPIPIGGGSAPVMSGGGTRMLPIGISKQALLNSYYQTQLIGFLYKQG